MEHRFVQFPEQHENCKTTFSRPFLLLVILAEVDSVLYKTSKQQPRYSGPGFTLPGGRVNRLVNSKFQMVVKPKLWTFMKRGQKPSQKPRIEEIGITFHGESEFEEHFGMQLFFSGHICYFRLKNPIFFQNMKIRNKNVQKSMKFRFNLLSEHSKKSRT